MAIIKAVGGGKSLYGVIRYITRNDKTCDDLIGGWNVDPQNAYEEMAATKKQWGKTDGRAFKHFIQSFHADDGITPEEAHAVAAEFIEQAAMFHDYEVLYATHVDCGHVHTHIVVNSVSIRDGHKFRYAKPALEEMKRLSDEIVQAHGYHLEHERPETENVTAWDRDLYQVLADAHEGKRDSWMYDMAMAVQSAEAAASDLNGFIQQMKTRGYSVRWGKKSITYTTPGGQRIRASRLEEIFKLPSVRWLYGDREEEQSQLQKDLHTAAEKEDGAMEDVPASEQPLPVDYEAFDLDLRRSADWLTGCTVADLHYEIACDICRQLRCAASAFDFEREMTYAGYYVQYNYRTRQYIFHHPSGVTVSNAELEAEFGLPSIADALDYMVMRPYVPPDYDGIIYALSQMRTWDEEYLRRLMADPDAKIPKLETDEVQHQEDSPFAQTAQHQSIVLDLYSSPNSPMWDQELRAAAIVFGRGMCDAPEQLDSYLAQNGYVLHRNGQKMCLQTSRGRYIAITPKDPKIDDDPNKPARIGSMAIIEGKYLCDLGKPEANADRQRLVDLAVQAVRRAATPEDVDAQLIGQGIHVLYHRLDKNGQTEREIISKDASITLDEALRQMGIEPQYVKKVPTANLESPLETAQNVPEAENVPTQGNTKVDDLRELLSIVSTAAATAADKPTFEAALAEAGCGTRWTRNGTLTFVLPGGAHIRSSQLEQRYRLPSISAAFGVERHAPKSGVRFEAAQVIRQVISQTSNRQEFDKALKAKGYTVVWLKGSTDAKIEMPNGRNTRLSNLEQTFRLPPVREVLSGIQYKAEDRRDNVTSKIGAAEIDGLRDALARAAESAAGAADSGDREIKENSRGSEIRSPETQEETGEGRPVGGTTQSTHHGAGQDDRSLASRIRRAQREKAAADPRTSVAHGRSKQNRRAGHER